jgi:hypothetical protein
MIDARQPLLWQTKSHYGECFIRIDFGEPEDDDLIQIHKAFASIIQSIDRIAFRPTKQTKAKWSDFYPE